MSVSLIRTAISTNQTKDHNQSWLMHPRFLALFKQFACFYFDISFCYCDVNPYTDWQLYFLWVYFFDTRLKSALVLLLTSWYSDTCVPLQQYQRRTKTTCNLVTCVFALSRRLFNWVLKVILAFCNFALLSCDWSWILAISSQPKLMKFKTKSNLNLVAHVFLRFSQFGDRSSLVWIFTSCPR